MNKQRNILRNAKAQQNRTQMKCPIRAFPYCHPEAGLDVFLDGQQRVIYLSCSACDRTIAKINVGKELDAQLE